MCWSNSIPSSSASGSRPSRSSAASSWVMRSVGTTGCHARSSIRDDVPAHDRRLGTVRAASGTALAAPASRRPGEDVSAPGRPIRATRGRDTGSRHHRSASRLSSEAIPAPPCRHGALATPRKARPGRRHPDPVLPAGLPLLDQAPGAAHPRPGAPPVGAVPRRRGGGGRGAGASRDGVRALADRGRRERAPGQSPAGGGGGGDQSGTPCLRPVSSGRSATGHRLANLPDRAGSARTASVTAAGPPGGRRGPRRRTAPGRCPSRRAAHRREPRPQRPARPRPPLPSTRAGTAGCRRPR
jgi:hypothetical protein